MRREERGVAEEAQREVKQPRKKSVAWEYAAEESQV